MKYNILVTGGTGFIGRNFISLLEKKKLFNIYSLSQKKIKKKLQNKNINYIFCNIENRLKLKKKLKVNFDFVVNLAGHKNHTEKKKTYQIDYIGLKNLAETLPAKNMKKFIQIGSSVEYGFMKSPQKEKTQNNTNKLKSIYGKSKLKSTNLLIKLHKKKNFPVLILRPYLIYGPGQSNERLIPFVINSCLNNKSFNLSSGKQIRNFLYVGDFSKILYKSLFLKTNEKILNTGSSKNYQVKFIIDKINKLVNKGYPRYGRINLRKDEPFYLYPDLNKFKKLIKFNTETKIENGLKKTIAYIKKLKNEKNLFN